MKKLKNWRFYITLILLDVILVESKEPPRILANNVDSLTGSISIDVESILTLNCEGIEPVKWKTHGRKDMLSRATEVAPKEPNFENKYQSTLEITETLDTDTGKFSCNYESNLESTDPENSAEIYVFVNDPKKVLLPVDYFFISVKQGMESILPCLPNNKNANVTLWQGSLGNDKNIPTDDFILRYEPTRGFIVNWAPVTFSGKFYCLGSLDGVTDNKTLIVQWMPSTNVVPEPTVQFVPKYAVLNEAFMLDCIVRSPAGLLYFLEWTTPIKKTDGSRVKIGELWSSERKREKGGNFIETKRNITIKSVRNEDIGTYICKVNDITQKSNQKSVYVDVKEEGESFIKFSLGSSDNPNEVFEHPVGTSMIKFAVEVDSYPSDPKLQWYKGDVALSSSNKYKIIHSPKMEILEIYVIERSDTGFYTLVGTVGKTTEEFKITVMVVETPEVSIRPDPPMYKIDDEFIIKCHVEGCPGSNITWMWSPCLNPDCVRSFTALTESLDNMELETEENVHGEISDGCHVQSVLTGKVTKAGYYKCFAKNELGSNSSEAPIFIKEFQSPFGITASDYRPYEGRELALTCYASRYKYSRISWFFIAPHEGIRITVTNTSNTLVKPFEYEYSFVTDVNINPVVKESSGDYICQAKIRGSNKWEEKRLAIRVYETRAPVIVETNLNSTEYTVYKEGHFEFICKTEGAPTPQVRWYLNGTLILAINDTAIQFLDNNSKLYIARTLPSDSGRYICEAANSAGVIIRNATLRVLDVELSGGLSKAGVIGIIVFIIVAIIVIIAGSVILGRRFYNEKKDKNDWAQLQHQLFDQGDVGQYNPELPLDEQVDTLPYDRSWEVPKERLRLGRVLGQGAFGRVLKGEIHNFVEGQEWTTVAVKMLKERADNEQRKALMQELKIMIHIGRHVNVVNLVGAVTKNLCKGELQVLVEYCKYGNLRHYLLKHRDNFIDQINLNTGEFDKTVQRTGNVFRFSDIYNSNSAGNSARTEMTVDSGGIDNTAVRLSGITSPTINTGRQLTTYDLICFSYQIAAGMIYLGSKKLVHRDLALRNILLADGDIVKICDFGLAKDVYRKNYYRKRGQGPLPYKWMAIESIRDKVYTTESDVWSYGILLWEIYTLGANPYPGMEVDDDFYNKLNSGYRMEKPQLAPKAMFNLMSQCWQYEPRSRPTFEEINNGLSADMDPETVENYVQLNKDYLLREVPFGHNMDYLSQLSNDLDAYVGVDPDSAAQTYVNGNAQLPVHVNASTGNVNYVNLLHPNDTTGLNHQRALAYGERGSDHPELAPMITSGHYLLPPAPKKLARASNELDAEQSYLDMGSKIGINQGGGDEEPLTVRSGNKRSSPPPRNS